MTAFKTERDLKKNDKNQIKKKLIFVHIYIVFWSCGYWSGMESRMVWLLGVERSLVSCLQW